MPNFNNMNKLKFSNLCFCFGLSKLPTLLFNSPATVFLSILQWMFPLSYFSVTKNPLRLRRWLSHICCPVPLSDQLAKLFYSSHNLMIDLIVLLWLIIIFTLISSLLLKYSFFHFSFFTSFTRYPHQPRGLLYRGAVSNFSTLSKRKLSKIYLFIFNENNYVKLIEYSSSNKSL